MTSRLPSLALGAAAVLAAWLAPWPWSLFGSDAPARTWFVPAALSVGGLLVAAGAAREARRGGVRAAAVFLGLSLPAVGFGLFLTWWTSHSALGEAGHFCERALAATDPAERASLLKTAEIPESHLAWFSRAHPLCQQARGQPGK
jgi:hypothetical protein